MTSSSKPSFDPERGLFLLRGEPPRWIWSFTCPSPKCECRSVLVLSAPGERETLLELGRPVAEAWRKGGDHGKAARALSGVQTFIFDLDSYELRMADGEMPLGPSEHPELRELLARLDDEQLDEIARNWLTAKGMALPPEPGANGAPLELEAWSPGELVPWDTVGKSLRGDLYTTVGGIVHARELYCVGTECQCGAVVIQMVPVSNASWPSPGHIEFNGKEATLVPECEIDRERLAQLWTLYCERHPDYAERFAKRSAVMHALGAYIVPKKVLPKVNRNEPCPCGSGKKYKKCCAA